MSTDSSAPIKKRKQEEEEEKEEQSSSSSSSPEQAAPKAARSALGTKLGDWLHNLLQWLRESTFELEDKSGPLADLWQQYVSDEPEDEDLDALLPDLLNYARQHVVPFVEDEHFAEAVEEGRHQQEKDGDDVLLWTFGDLVEDLDKAVAAMNPGNPVKHKLLKSLLVKLTATPEDWLTLLAEVQELSEIVAVK